MIGIKFIKEIDKTLDILINNTSELSSIDLKNLSTEEFAIFKTKQKELLFHLFDLDTQFQEKKEQIRTFKKPCKSTKKSLTTYCQSVLEKRRPRTNRPKKKVL